MTFELAKQTGKKIWALCNSQSYPYLIGGYIIGFGVYMFVPNLLNLLTLEPAYILHGQIWRIISWVLIPPSGNIFTTVIMMLFYYSLGTALERTWGAFRYNVYIFRGSCLR